ncbi:hypothetical protein CJJ09_003748 [Candidozyma auris]|nr:hypothetical protein CJJ09_003748 [[Candida] auris]
MASLCGELAFLNNYEYFVTDKNYYEKETTPFNSEGPYAGTTDALSHGAAFRSKYSDVFDSRTRFLGDDFNDEKVDFAVIAEEDKFGANSLTPVVSCKNYHSGANNEFVKQFDTSYLSAAAARITKGNDGFSLSEKEVDRLIAWATLLCNLFTNDELVRNSYASDLSYYYSNGPGNNLTATIGAPFLKATLDYLKEENPPQKVVLAFTHDTNIEQFHSALGIVAPDQPLPNDYIPFPVPYAHTQIVPMGARLYTEKYKCGNDSYVRYVVNDAVVPIKHCQNGPGFSCKLSDYENYINSRLEAKTMRPSVAPKTFSTR